MKDNQAKYPQLRFKGFTDPWDKRYLGDYVVDYTEKTTQENQFPVLTSSQQQGIVLQSEYFTDRQVTTDENIGYFVLPRGYFTYRSRSDNNIFVFNRNDIIDKGIISYFYPVFGLINADSNFFLRRINNGLNRQLAIAAEGTGQHVLSLKKFKKMETRFPSLPEQKQIGEFLECLDDLITVNQRKLAKLKELKQGYLQKLFPRNGSKFPQLRFAGFADDWEVRKLKDVLDISKTKNKAQQYGKVDVLSVSREVGTVNQIKYQGRSFAGSDLSNYKVVQGGELIYTKSPLKGAPYGIFQVATIKGILSPLYAVYTSTDKAYTPFVAMALKNDNIATHYLTPLVTKGAKNTINVTDEGALEGKIQFPSILEQKQIFIFFKQLDDTIALHQRKLDLLKEQKKGFLQKMFV
ncbi:restriction endonuclease subunit S [Lactiplantibacillus pentosus]|uniref:restriction endonuclease subunit S n=1 Tax=Lactiplantibacillus pentosus TaxID=1589 RepID=UPI0021820DC8|nr:restriction endonuclease subunit S [Lactiplantibacillus pentosus]MCS8603004.1 restriction endonuclease subunit S [Lactiplantibacillus pentosus]